MTGLRIEHIHKRFEKTVALDDISLEIRPGELFFLLGPSGCGKSTLLRIIAGLQDATSGTLYFNDKDVTHLPTQQRNAVMCFQSYALWPHLSVAQNVSFGLAVRGMGPAEQKARVAEVLHMVQMEAYAERKPNQLSGGQQQRVALARALAVQPACLLLDEPLSNLDAKLRLEMRAEIRRICKTAGLTTIYVTHDQKEALSIADRIAVLRDGHLVQVGSPADLYHTPVNSFVAQFIGQTNLLPGRIIARDAQAVRVETAAGTFTSAAGGSVSDKVVVSIRPERIRVGGSRSANNVTGKLVETTFTGEASEHVVEVQGQRLKIVHMPPLFDPPVEMTIEIDERDVVLLPE